MKIGELNDLIAAVAPIDGINSNGVIWFKPEASPAQMAEAMALMETHLPTVVP